MLFHLVQDATQLLPILLKWGCLVLSGLPAVSRKNNVFLTSAIACNVSSKHTRKKKQIEMA